MKATPSRYGRASEAPRRGEGHITSDRDTPPGGQGNLFSVNGVWLGLRRHASNHEENFRISVLVLGLSYCRATS